MIEDHSIRCTTECHEFLCPSLAIKHCSRRSFCVHSPQSTLQRPLK
uniref:Uncharacterized protein n=1 Tax=Arundo donax TaxID=35708 RepID=A0A0A8Y470_ARUDO